MTNSAFDSRTKRLLDLVVLLLDVKQPVPFSELREQFADYRTAKPEAGLRAFERDKATLVELGVPIRYVTAEENPDVSSEGGYQIDRRAYRMPEVTLNPDEVAALVVTAAAARHQPEFPYRHAAELAVRKLMFDMAGLGKRARQAAPQPPGQSADVLVHMPSLYRSRSLAENLATLEEAVRLRKRVTFHYDHPRPEARPPAEPGDGVPQPVATQHSDKYYASPTAEGHSAREVDPYGLVYRQGAWLLVGRCHSARGVRRFRIDRILDLKVAPKPRTPDFEVPTDFSLQEHGSFSPWRFEREPRVRTRLWVSAETPWVAEEDFGPAARAPAEAGAGQEGVVVEFQCGNPAYLLSRVLGAAGSLRVLEPDSLRRRVAEAAEATAWRNGGASE